MRNETEVGRIIRELRGDMSLRDFAKKCDISHTTIDNLEKGFDFRTKKPTQAKLTTVQKIADACGVPVSYIIGEDHGNPKFDIQHFTETAPRKKGIKIPVLGNVAAGIPLEAITDVDDYEEISEAMAAGGEYVALRIHGDSMEPRMQEGDVVIVRVQDTIESGETAIVMVNGDEATCKRVKITPDGIMLISNNPDYEPMFYSRKQVEELPVRIFGKVVELRAKFR